MSRTLAAPHSPRKSWAEVAARAAFLHERIASQDCSGGPERDAEALLERWCERAAGGDPHRFRRRLAWDGLTIESARQLCAGRPSYRGPELPAWVQSVEAGLKAAADNFHPPEPAPLWAHAPISYQEVLLPFVATATARARDAAGENWAGLSGLALQSLQRYLLSRLSLAACQTLGIELAVWRETATARPGPHADPAHPGFVSWMAQGGLREVLERYPVLARLVGDHTQEWVEFVVRFLDHLAADRDALSRTFAGGAPLGPLVRIETGLSDPHAGGRSVLEVEFENGTACVYKPHSLGCERAFQSVLEWTNHCGSPLQFRTLSGVYLADHGWMEAVSQVPCLDEDQVDRYFARAGMLLCLLFVLEAGDCHAGNLIAQGEFPIVLDLETLLEPTLCASELGEEESAIESAGRRLLRQTVFRVGMLPRWIATAGQWRCIGGLAGGDNAGRHVVKLRGGPVDPARHVDQINAGFEQMYRWLMQHSQEFLEHCSGPWGMRELLPRFLFRSTSLYWQVLANARNPRSLESGIAASLETEVLCRRFTFAAEKPPVWRLIHAEQQALLGGDVPRFHADAAGLISSAGAGLAAVRITTGFDNFRKHLGNLSEDELERQAALIRLAFPAHAESAPSPARSAGGAGQVRRFPATELVQEAVRIGQCIRDAAVLAGSGAPIWLTRAFDADGQICQMQPMGLRLYDGICGPALYLSALERVAPGQGFGELAQRTFVPALESGAGRAGARFWCFGELGAGIGVGSLIYALARGGVMLGQEQLIDRAGQLARSINEVRIRDDRFLDLVRGCAGLLVALLALYACRGQAWVLRLARNCGDRLLELQPASAPDGAGAGEAAPRLHSGFAHGRAGIAFALSRLSAATGESRFRAAGWTLAPSPSQAGGDGNLADSWCNGRAGILLARIAGFATAGSRPDATLIAALDRLCARPLASLDHVCCGNLGRAETLLQAGLRLGEPRFCEAAATLAADVVARSRRDGEYRLGAPAGFQPVSFHQGLAGIGYQLLRLACPQQIPCVLLWE